MRHLGLGILGLLSLAVLWTTAGCTASGNVEFTTEARLDQGLVIILPGIEGESHMNHDIRRGLVAAGIYRALPIHLWGRPIPGVGMLLNQMDVIGNRLAGGQIAKMITAYQDSHPGRPVYLVGHSGGGGVAVFSAEALPPGRKVDGLVLLSASISKGYDLTKALGKCRNGIVNFYSEADVGFLVIGTIVAGNVDGVHGPAAGAVGFDWPTDAKQRAAYSKLYQVSMNEAMTGGGDP
ncbi:MAG: hypothetical protein SVT52_08010, partial [Planctomycetota bacterium]|nr:hypothetical protein [Planctomycetota bacterium]